MNKYAKAVVAALVAGLGALQFALKDNTVSTTEWVQVGSTAVAALGLVWGVQNAPAAAASPVVPVPAELPDPGVTPR